VRRRPRAAGLRALVLLVAAACGAGPGETPRTDGRVTILGHTVEVEVRRTPAERARGLSGRAALGPGRGMLFLHERAARHAYWMKDMRFDLDMVWLRAGRVVDVTHGARRPAPGAPPGEVPVYAPEVPADAVLEVPAGTARTHGWRPGLAARIEIENPERSRAATREIEGDS